MKKILIIILGFVALLGLAGLIYSLIPEDDGLKEINPTFTRGGLNQSGQWLETNSTIYTKDMFECQGLEIDLDFEHNVYFEVFLYDEDSKFIKSSGKLNSKYILNDFNCTYARIVITPDWSVIDNSDKEISFSSA